MARITIKDLSKNYGPLRCLDKVNLEIGDGQLAAIVGPSGCGKTTLMRCIAGLETFSEGSIYIDDELINEKEPKDRDVAMVFQYYALYPHMTVFQNLSLGLEHTTSLSKEEIRRRVEEISEVLKISKFLKRKPGQLSGGESQRVAIGRALVRKPKVFLLDEPLSAVDTKLRRDLRSEIKRIQRSFGVTTLYITHDQEEAMAVADQLVVIGSGVIHQVGIPEDVFNRPKDQFVARFIGKPPMNLLALKAENEGGRHLLRNGSFSYEVSRESYDRYLTSSLGKSVIVGVRPSAIKILEGNARSPETITNSGTLSLIENMGNENYLYLNLNSDRMVVKTVSQSVPEIGDVVRFTFEEEDMYLFDMTTKESLKK